MSNTNNPLTDPASWLSDYLKENPLGPVSPTYALDALENGPLFKAETWKKGAENLGRFLRFARMVPQQDLPPTTVRDGKPYKLNPYTQKYEPDTGRRDAQGRLLPGEEAKAAAWRAQGQQATLGGKTATWDASKGQWTVPATASAQDDQENPYTGPGAGATASAGETARRPATGADLPEQPASSVPSSGERPEYKVDPSVTNPLDVLRGSLEALGPQAAAQRMYALKELEILAAARRGDIQQLTEAKVQQAYLDKQKAIEVARQNAMAAVGLAITDLSRPSAQLLQALNANSASLAGTVGPYNISLPTPRTTLG